MTTRGRFKFGNTSIGNCIICQPPYSNRNTDIAATSIRLCKANRITPFSKFESIYLLDRLSCIVVSFFMDKTPAELCTVGTNEVLMQPDRSVLPNYTVNGCVQRADRLLRPICF